MEQAQLRVMNWSKHQSYKDRRPPWVRLQKTLLDNFEYQSMSADARALLPMLWLLASEDDDPTSGVIPFDAKRIAFRLRQPLAVILSAIDECVSSGFVERIESVSEPYSIRSETVPPETETETETETYPLTPTGRIDLDDGFSTFWLNYPNKVGKPAALKAFKRAAPRLDELIAGLERWKASESWRKDKGRFIPYPSTFLNQRRWEDIPLDQARPRTETELLNEDAWAAVLNQPKALT